MRNKAIDIEKGFGIILVAVGHNWVIGQNYEELYRIIYSFHVPLFFFLAGVLFQTNITFPDLIKQKWHSILKPYFTVSVGVLLNVVISEKAFPFGNLIGILFATGQSILWEPMWFLPHLFITVIFSWYLLSYFKLTQRRKLAYIVIVIMLVMGILMINYFRLLNLGPLVLSMGRSANLIGLPFSIDLIFISASYFILGNVTSNSVKNYEFNLSYLALSLILFAFSHYFFNESIYLNGRIYGGAILSTIQAFCGIYLTIAISETLKNIKMVEAVFSYIGSGSLFILIFHGTLQGKAISKFMSIFPASGLIGGLFGLVAGISFSLLIWEVIKRVPIASAFMLPSNLKTPRKA